jgi:hypothetical protein
VLVCLCESKQLRGSQVASLEWSRSIAATSARKQNGYDELIDTVPLLSGLGPSKLQVAS